MENTQSDYTIKIVKSTYKLNSNEYFAPLEFIQEYLEIFKNQIFKEKLSSASNSLKLDKGVTLWSGKAITKIGLTRHFEEIETGFAILDDNFEFTCLTEESDLNRDGSPDEPTHLDLDRIIVIFPKRSKLLKKVLIGSAITVGVIGLSGGAIAAAPIVLPAIGLSSAGAAAAGLISSASGMIAASAGAIEAAAVATGAFVSSNSAVVAGLVPALALKVGKDVAVGLTTDVAVSQLSPIANDAVGKALEGVKLKDSENIEKSSQEAISDSENTTNSSQLAITFPETTQPYENAEIEKLVRKDHFLKWRTDDVTKWLKLAFLDDLIKPFKFNKFDGTMLFFLMNGKHLEYPKMFEYTIADERLRADFVWKLEHLMGCGSEKE